MQPTYALEMANMLPVEEKTFLAFGWFKGVEGEWEILTKKNILCW